MPGGPRHLRPDFRTGHQLADVSEPPIPVDGAGLLVIFAGVPVLIGVLLFLSAIEVSLWPGRLRDAYQHALGIGALILAPLTYQITRIDPSWWRVGNKDDATLCCLPGFVLLVVSLHLVNWLAMMWGRFAQMMLGPDTPAGR